MTLGLAGVARARSSAEADLQSAAGGGAVCAFTRAGVAVPGVKYHEGRWAALREVERAVRASGGDPTEVAARVRTEWSEDLARLRSREAGPDWIAYRSGGIDAVVEVLAAD